MSFSTATLNPSNRTFRLFVILACIFITNALLAEFIGVKIFSMEDSLGMQRAELQIWGGKFSFHLTAGVLLWPVVFLTTDVINEYFGERGVRFLSFLTVALIVFAFGAVSLAIHLKPSEFFNLGSTIANPDAAFGAVFGQGLWIIVGSVVAFLVGQLLDVAVFHRIKRITGGRRVWLRATGSTLVSQLIDSFVVLWIAFYLGPLLSGATDKQWTGHQVLVTGTGNYIYKFVIAILCTPLLYGVHALIRRYLGKDNAAALSKYAMTVQTKKSSA